MKKRFLDIIVFLFLFSIPAGLMAQAMPANDNAISAKYSFVSTIFNRILNSSGLDSFYKKLYELKTKDNGLVSIVHIGDSHIQADFLSGVVRNGLQEFFGDAGRGLVFPYQLAQSNAPDDISSTSNTRWKFNRLAHPEISIPPGISGHGIRTNTSGAAIHLSLRGIASPFNRLKFFTDSADAVTWTVKADNSDSSYELKKNGQLYKEIDLENASTGFSLTSHPTDATKELYGISLENSNSGIIYHTIGVNGARYDQYNNADLFWQQLPALKADLFIVSLGTNEAQWDGFSETAFYRTLSAFIEKLKQASPGASVLFTTAPDSYKNRRYNTVLRQLNTSLAGYCNKNYLPLWDLYQITNGYGSAYSWTRRGLMTRDRIHFTPDGYRLQGNLLLGALAKGYNGYIGR
ncbi:MAG: GDSL-type esterase/lipase family protein [Chitinophagaceae bacterium]